MSERMRLLHDLSSLHFHFFHHRFDQLWHLRFANLRTNERPRTAPLRLRRDKGNVQDD